MACEDSLNNIGDLPLLIGISTYTSEATAASPRTEDFKVVGIRSDDEGEGDRTFLKTLKVATFVCKKSKVELLIL